ncbi:hypothetical protein TEPIDINF_001508 [Tepidibacillus infernus]|uniref:hypothetical protein n=1 Tax=Tepidibacillus TaxID=1494427 RepID=UPI000853DFBF|nr:hypothetical protein [Tepidibacillus sp. HK-1]GBF10417.1 hypothetical protein HK1_00429 [Tepidibacillus sp. HK-1]
MQIYFSPELIAQDTQILNIVDQNQKAVGFVTIIFNQNKIYVHGNLEEGGVEGDFKDLIKPYLGGLKKVKSEADIYAYLSVGGKKIQLEEN